MLEFLFATTILCLGLDWDLRQVGSTVGSGDAQLAIERPEDVAMRE